MSWVSMVANPLLPTWREYTVPHSQFAVIIFSKSKFSLTSSHGWGLGSCDHWGSYHVTTKETLSDYWEDYYASHVTIKEIIMWPLRLSCDHTTTEETPCDYWEVIYNYNWNITKILHKVFLIDKSSDLRCVLTTKATVVWLLKRRLWPLRWSCDPWGYSLWPLRWSCDYWDDHVTTEMIMWLLRRWSCDHWNGHVTPEDTVRDHWDDHMTTEMIMWLLRWSCDYWGDGHAITDLWWGYHSGLNTRAVCPRRWWKTEPPPREQQASGTSHPQQALYRK